MPSPRTSATPRPHPQRPRPEATPDIAALPTPKQIAAMLRNRSLGAVLIEICQDLGVAPGELEAELWNELSGTIIDYGGNLCAYLTHMMNQMFSLPPELRKVPRQSRHSSPSPCIESQSSPPVLPALATGPP
jgi:hypothetical protein